MQYTEHLPEIAIIDPNTLSCMGLKSLLETLIPRVTVRCFGTFGQLIDDTPDMYAHYFVASAIVLEHSTFFLERKKRTIVLTGGNYNTMYTFHTLDVSLPENQLTKALLQLHGQAHKPDSPSGHSSAYGQREETNIRLSTREVEVLVLIVRGLINKEIADRLNISLTTVISHRKNITEKLGIRSVSGLTVYAVMNGLIEVNQI